MTHSLQVTRKQAARSVLTLLLVGLAIHLILPQISVLENSLQVVRALKPWALGLALGAQVISYLGSGYLLRGIAALEGQQLSPIRGMLITAASYTVGLVAGGMIGGASATYRWMRQSGVPSESAVLAGWLPGLLDDVLLILLALMGVLFLLFEYALTTLQIVSFLTIALILGLIIASAYWGTRHRQELSALIERIAKRWALLRHRPHPPEGLNDAVNRFIEALNLFFGKGWKAPVIGASMSIFFDMTTLYFIFVASGHMIRPGVLLVGYGLPLLFGKVPILPGGVGLVEGTMTALYSGMGISNPVTVVVVLTYRLLSFWLPVLLGMPLIAILGHEARSRT